MKRSLFVLLVCVAVLGPSIAGQEKPTFAGTWKLAADAAPDMFTPPQMAVVQDGKVMTVTVSGQMGELKTIYNMDGSEAKSPIEFNGQAFDRVTKTAWEGGKLLLTVTANFNGQSFETKAVWSLGADGKLVIETTRPDFQGGGGPVTTKGTYTKG